MRRPMPRWNARHGLWLIAAFFLAVFVNIARVWRAPTGLPPSARGAAAAGDPCDDVFRLSRRGYRWDAAAAGLQTCAARSLAPASVNQCLQAQAEARPDREPARVVFVGDSRVRIIFSRMIKRLGLSMFNRTSDVPPPGAPTSSNVTGAPAHCTEAFHLQIRITTNASEPLHNMTTCSHAGGGAWLRLQFWMRPYLMRSFRATAAQLVASCRRRPTTCPRLVVVNSGLWYARRFSLTMGEAAADWVLRYRRDLTALLAPLRQLAAVTRVLWKLEEPVFLRETSGSRPDIEMAALTTVHALVFTMTADVPELVVWSAGLPDSGRFERQVCGVGRQQKGGRSNAECGDAYHVGATVLDGQTTDIFNFLCRAEPKAPGPLCCRGRV